MSVVNTVKNKIQNLIDSANEITGKQYETLVEGVEELIEGYGKGSGSNLKKAEEAKF